MRALRDFNTPKIVTEDTNIFIGLIGDLFPALDVPRKRNIDFEKQVYQATLDLKLQPEENFILKVLVFYYYFIKYHLNIKPIYIINTGSTISRVARGSTFCFHNRFGRYRKIRSLENIIQDLCEYETETLFQRYRTKSSHQRRVVWRY